MKKNNKKLFFFLAAWLLLIAGGSAGLLIHAARPGKENAAPNRWPLHSALSVSNKARGTLLVFAHPDCDCTKATLAELERLTAVTQKNLHVIILLVSDKEKAREQLPALRARFPLAEVRLDLHGIEAKQFGALTSGQTYLYSAEGKKVFQGGITASRGHEGDNYGVDAIRSWISEPGRALASSSTPVFGCALFAAEKLHSHEVAL